MSIRDIARKEREKQELLGLKENDKLEMKACYEQQIVLERKLSEEKEKHVRSETQVCMLLERKEPPLPAMNLTVSRPTASTVSMTSAPVFVKPAVPYNSIVRNVIPSPGLASRMVTGQKPVSMVSTTVPALVPTSKQVS